MKVTSKQEALSFLTLHFGFCHPCNYDSIENIQMPVISLNNYIVNVAPLVAWTLSFHDISMILFLRHEKTYMQTAVERVLLSMLFLFLLNRYTSVCVPVVLPVSWSQICSQGSVALWPQ